MRRLQLDHIQEKDWVSALPVKAIQFGEGNFLRGFVDWMIHRMNAQQLFNGRVTVIQPIEHGAGEVLNEQDGLYTLLIRGVHNGELVQERELVTSMHRVINPYQQYEAYLQTALNPRLRFVFSNTTEAGIVYSPQDRYEDVPPSTFPGKLTVWLHKRYEAFAGDPDKGVIVLPCELIDRNGDELRQIVLRLADEWKLGDAFIEWVTHHNFFLNTLVDRIVTGYPRDEIEELTQQVGYEDRCFVAAELYHLWVIEGDARFAQELPLAQAGLNVVWTEDMAPYRTRKVRILNGAHTMTALAAYLYGVDTVKACMDDPTLRRYMEIGINEEIIPALDLPREELLGYASAVLDRFANPYNKHYLLSISLNSTSKFKTRVLPSIKEYAARHHKLPRVLTFALASLIAFYRGTEIQDNQLIGTRADGSEYRVSDDPHALELFREAWSTYERTYASALDLARKLLGYVELWGEDLNRIAGLPERVASDLHAIVTDGMPQAIQGVIRHA